MNRMGYACAWGFSLLLAGRLLGQAVWSDAGNDANWSTETNWVDGTAPSNPYTGTVGFGDAGRYATNRMDQSWNLRYLQYTNVSGFFQCFDDIAFPPTADYTTRTNRDWIAYRCSIIADVGARLDVTGGCVRAPGCITGIGCVQFRYKNAAGKTAPAATFELQLSPDADNWTTIATLTCPLSTDWSSFSTNLNDAANFYAQVLNTSTEARVDIDNFDVTFRLPAIQTTDLGGNRLIISNGHLRVGDTGSRNGQINHTRVVLTNGTVQIGASSGVSDLAVGYMDSLLDAGGERRGNQLAIQGTLDSAGLNNLYVGTVTYTTGSQWTEGLLDLRQATLCSGDEADSLTAERLYVGVATGSSTGHGRGELLLPAGLRHIETGEMLVGCDGTGYSGSGSTGRVDFGASSQLESLTVKRFLNLGSGAFCVLDRWPKTVDVMVGEADAPGQMWIGAGGGRWSRISKGFGAHLAVSNASFTGFLRELYIGVAMDYTEGNSITGVLDLAHAEVQIGSTPNAMHVPDLRIGGHRYIGNPSACSGTLLLPPSLHTLSCGIFQLGADNGGVGILDFGQVSRFARFQATNEFHYGYGGGRAYMPGLPVSNLVFEIGRSGCPASVMNIGVTQKKDNYSESTFEGQADFVLNGATFTACVNTLQVGVSAYEGTQNNGDAVGNLVLTNATLAAFDVLGHAMIGRASPKATYKRATGRVRLPVGVMNIVGNLNLGGQRYGTFPAQGLLDLHGTTVRIGGVCDIWETGSVQTRLKGTPAGIDLLSSTADALSISNGAAINLLFAQDPVEPGEHYWGVRWAGEHVARLQDFCASNRIVCATNTLSPKLAVRVGVWYDPRKDFSFVGIQALPHATLLMIR